MPQFEVRHNGRFIAGSMAALPQWRSRSSTRATSEHTGKTALVRDSRRRNELLAVRMADDRR